MASKTTNLDNPGEFAEAAEAIYARLYKADFEKNHRAEYVAINVDDESATLGASLKEAIDNARKKYPHGFFHLIRIGHAGAFEVGPAFRHADPSRIHR